MPMKDPFHIQWHITNLCNLRCRHCYQEDFSTKYDLDGKRLREVSGNVFSTLKEWNQGACIHLTGGEPLLKPELFSLLDTLNQESMVEELGIITNGLLINPELLKKLSSYPKLRKIKVSLDGADPEVNDLIRPRGTFQQVVRNLSLIKKEESFEPIVMFTVMKKNYQNLPSLLSLCQDLGMEGVILERFIPWGRGREMMDEVLERNQWKRVVETLFTFSSLSVEEDGVFPYQAYQIRFNGDEVELQGAPCVLGRDGLCIMPGGTVYPCRRFPISVGNLLEKSLKEIWQKSELLEKLRDKNSLKGKCGRCEVEDCSGCRSLALSLTGDYLEEDPHCWHIPELES
jgi:radical SAM protein with 4Fe4S-binding SPASM domain